MDSNLKKRRVKLHFKESIEPQEIFLDSIAQSREKDFGISEKKIEVPISRLILQGVGIFFLVLVLIFFGKTFQIQILEGKELSRRAEENKFIISSIRAERGVIYDKNLKQLVFNIPAFDLVCLKNELPSEKEKELKIIKEVAQITNQDLEYLINKIESSAGGAVIPIFKNLDHQTLILLETKISKLPGFQIENNTIRNYRDGENFAHLLGYTGKITAEELKNSESYSITDLIGRDGLEKSYEAVLKKNPGKLKMERDALGNIISKEILSLPESGKSLVLWLDSDLQKKIKEELEKILQITGSRKAAAIALDPQTGGVLSLISLPSFDNNLFNKGADPELLKKLLEDPQELRPFFNRAISGRYPTGSTIKPLTASAALEEKIISPEKKINCQGGISVQDYWNPDKVWEYEDWRTHGWTDMRKAIAESCNVYFYTVGGGYQEQEGLGPTRIKKYLELFGWGNKTEIDIPGEAKGFIPDKEWKKKAWQEDWWDGDTYLLSIGQGYLLVTPLEVAASFVSIANGGKLLRPQAVQKIVETSGETTQTVKEFEPEVIRQNFINPENLQVVREGMRQAVSGENSPYASAFLLNSLPVKAAAKTGTAETGRKEGGEKIYHNWITVFAPYENPEIVLTIIIQDVKGVQSATLPIAKNVLEWYFTK